LAKSGVRVQTTNIPLTEEFTVEIKAGTILRGPQWPEPVEVNYSEDLGEYIRIVGVTIHARVHVDRLIKKTDLPEVEGENLPLFGAKPRSVFLSLEAKRYRFASLYDPLLAMNTCKVDPLPHQIEAVYGFVLQLPRIRFLIADDPGAGKTIMAGLIIKELKLRNLVKRVLIIAPGHLKEQWQREMRERFEESFIKVDRGLMDASYGENIWQRESQLIASIDFAKQDDVAATLASSRFDLIIVDEAHKMSAYRYGEKLDKTGRYKLGEVLSDISTNLLFLTATPHRGDPENFRLFLDLLEPGFFATTDMVAESIRNQENPLFIRRVKEDLKDFEGKPLFLPRYVDTVAFRLGIESPKEVDLYNALSKYVNEQYNKALTKQDKRRNIAFALVILQRRLASSTFALLKSLERRKKRLDELLEGATQNNRNGYTAYNPNGDEEDEDEQSRWAQEEVWETLSVAENQDELRAEIETLKDLIRKAKAIVESESEAKLRHFKDSLTKLNDKFPGAKILIFTESRDTLTHLEKHIKDKWGYTVCTIHGGMRLEERINAERTFKNEAQVMIATEAAGEGINLQFCNLMINYDLPWNPNRLEQRMGRIHRYGQTREVFIFNLVAEDTREGRVMKSLFDKITEIKEALGSDKVFDVLGDLIQGVGLAQIMVEAAAGARSMDEILKDINITVDREYIQRVRDNLGESLATRYIDYTRIKEKADQAREYRLIPEYTEAFFKRAFEVIDGKWTPKTVKEFPQGSFLTIDSIPYQLKQVAEEETFRRQHGTLLRRFPLATFDKAAAMRVSQAEFISFGHPLFEALLIWVERNLADTLSQGAVYTDPDGKMDGILFFYQGEILDGRGHVTGTRLFALFNDINSGEMSAVNPAILWDIKEGGTFSDNADTESLKRKTFNVLLPELEKYKATLLTERERQATIKEKYGVRSLEHLILKLDGDLIGLYSRRDMGENVERFIKPKEDQKASYEHALQELRTGLQQERSLSIGSPRFIGMARIVPEIDATMVSDADIEKIGMEMTMQHEREQGWTPEDVSKENLGFDVRSTSPDGHKRYIEVKARAEIGAVALTQNEWFKAKRFGDEYYLYAVLNASKTPLLYKVQNPAALLKPEEQVEVRYMVSASEIQSKGERA
jgi:superfamily II DNA or RNA helicase